MGVPAERAIVVGDGLPEGGTGFVVHGVKLRGLLGLFEMGVEGLIGGNAVRVTFGGKGMHKDSITGAVQGNHEALVATARARVEAPHVICKQLDKGYI